MCSFRWKRIGGGGCKTLSIKSPPSNLPKEYENVSTQPVDATTHLTIRHDLNYPAALQNLARVTGHAFRINGKTYYKRK